MTPIFIQATIMTTAFLLLSLVLSTPITTTTEFVLDSEGNPLVGESFYYAVPLSPSITQRVGGGLTMFNNHTTSCPSFIVAQSSIRGPLDYGIPLKFIPKVYIENYNIYSSFDVNIAFKYLRPQPMCRRWYSSVWTLSGPESGNLVVLDGHLASDGSWFKLKCGYHFGGDNYYSIWYGDNIVLSYVHGNGDGILLSLHRGNPLFVKFVKEESSMIM